MNGRRLPDAHWQRSRFCAFFAREGVAVAECRIWSTGSAVGSAPAWHVALETYAVERGCTFQLLEFSNIVHARVALAAVQHAVLDFEETFPGYRRQTGDRWRSKRASGDGPSGRLGRSSVLRTHGDAYRFTLAKLEEWTTAGGLLAGAKLCTAAAQQEGNQIVALRNPLTDEKRTVLTQRPRAAVLGATAGLLGEDLHAQPFKRVTYAADWSLGLALGEWLAREAGLRALRGIK